MTVAFWVVAGLFAVAMVAAGLTKLARPKSALASSGMEWVEHFSAGPIKLIGAVEVLGAIGLVLPPLVDIAPVLSPIAAIALAALMVGAIITHARLKESPAAPAVLFIVAVATAVLGFLTVA